MAPKRKGTSELEPLRLLAYYRVSDRRGRDGPSFISVPEQQRLTAAAALTGGHEIIDTGEDMDRPRGSNGRWQRGFRPRVRLLELRCAEARRIVDVLDESLSVEQMLDGMWSVWSVPTDESSLGFASRRRSPKAAA
jgi:hypothetical protein